MAGLVLDVTDMQARSVPTLRSNLSWTLAGGLVYSGCQWGMISALAKLGSAVIVGRFALGLAITAPVFMFTNLQLRSVQATDARSEFAFADYFTLRVLASLTALLTVCLVVVASRYDMVSGVVILLVGVSKTVESLGDVIAGLLQKAERLKRVAISLMLRGVLSLPGFVLAFWLTRDLLAAVAVLIGVWTSVFLLYDMHQARLLIRAPERFFAFRWARLKLLAMVSAPLGVVMTLISLNVNIPRYALEHFDGPADVGIFASLAYIVVAVNLLVNAVGQSSITRLSALFAEGKRRRFTILLMKLAGTGMAILAVCVPVACFCGRPLLTILYRAEYGEHVSVLITLIISSGIGAIAFFLTCGLSAARCFRPQVPIFVASTLTGAVGSFLLVPDYGLDGAAMALLFSSIVGLGGNVWALSSILQSSGKGKPMEMPGQTSLRPL